MKTEARWCWRPFRSGDVGMLSARQAILYDQLYGWGRPLEALIYEIAAKFLRAFKAGREQCWVAERHGQMLGAVMLVEDDAGSARLRLRYVRPKDRGSSLGVGLCHQYRTFQRSHGRAP